MRWRRNLLGSEGRHGGPEWYIRVQPASAKIETIFSISESTDLGILEGGTGNVLFEEEEESLLSEDFCW